MNVHISEAIEILRRGGYDISQSLVREYEKQGLLTPEKTESSYRLFSTDDLNRIRFILIARILNIPVKNIKLLLDFADTGKIPKDSIYQGEELSKYVQELCEQATTIAKDLSSHFSDKLLSVHKKYKNNNK